MKQKLWRNTNRMLAILFALLLSVQVPISQGESESVTIVQEPIKTAAPATESLPPIIESTTLSEVSTAPDISAIPETTADPATESLPLIIEPTTNPDVTITPDASVIPETTAAPATESLPSIIEPTTNPDVTITPDVTAIPETTAAPATESLPPIIETTATPDVSTAPDVTAIPETTAAPATESLPPIIETTATPDVSIAPDISAIPETTAAPAPQVISTRLLEKSLMSAPNLQNTITDASLSGGDVYFSDFTAVVLDGTSQTTTAAWSMNNIIDTRGTGDGWNVSLTLTQFKEWSGNGYVSSGDTLGPSSVRIKARPEVYAADELSSSAEQITVVRSTTALDTGTPVKLLTSGNGEGMGSFSVSGMTITLTVPANAYAHTYKTDAIIALNSGP